MRSILLLGMAAGSLLLAERATSAELPSKSSRDAPTSAAFIHDPAPRLEYRVPANGDTRVYTGAPDRVPGEIDYRRAGQRPIPDAHFQGRYDAEGRWTGSWRGTYEDAEGRRFDGTYEGMVAGQAGAGYPPPPHHIYEGGGFDPRHDAEMERRCGGGGQAGGAVVGAVVGGIAGNRIAGPGDRAAGTLIGGGAGALAGAAISNEADRARCDQWWASRAHYRGYYSNGHHPGSATVYQYGGHPDGHGYAYYTPAIIVTTMITSGAPIVTETIETTTQTYYDAPVKKRYAPRKRSKPKAKAKPRCLC